MEPNIQQPVQPEVPIPQPIPEVLSKSSKTKIILFILLALIILGIVGVSGYYLGARKERTQQPIIAKPTVIPTNAPTPLSTTSATPTPQTSLSPTIDVNQDLNELKAVINSTNNSNYVVTVEKIIDNYARGQISFGAGGAGWYAVKINGQWKKIAEGQNMSSDECNSLVQQYSIPKEILECPL